MVEPEPQKPAPTEPAKPEEPSEPVNDPIKTTTERYDKLKETNDKIEAELLRAEELKAKASLGGDTIGTEKPKPKSADEKYNEEAKERYAGTGLDPTPDDTPTTFS